MENCISISGYDAVRYSSSAFSGRLIRCCGADLEPDIALLQARMTECGVPLAEQKEMWIQFINQLPHPRWAALCLEQAEQLAALLVRQQALLGSVQKAEPTQAAVFPTSDCATKHFEWRGANYGISAEALREGILQLSKMGLVAHDAEQQSAMRRGLGLAANAAERSTNIPWVRWLGPSDMLNYMIKGLFGSGLIWCAGGDQQKWNTARGLFVRHDGRLFLPSLKSSHCTNREKRDLMESRFLRPMTRLVPQR